MRTTLTRNGLREKLKNLDLRAKNDPFPRFWVQLWDFSGKRKTVILNQFLMLLPVKISEKPKKKMK